MVLGRARRAVRRCGPGADRPPPQGSQAARAPLGHGGDLVAQPGRLAGEHDPAARRQHAVRTRRTRARRFGRWCRTAWPSTRSKLPSGNGSDSASARAVRTSSAEALGVAGQHAHHARGDVGAGRFRHDAGLEQVEAEVAGAGTDLQRPRVSAVELGSDELAELAEHLGLPDLAEVDAPLRVVARRRDVVIPGVDVPDLLRCEDRLHCAAHSVRCCTGGCWTRMEGHITLIAGGRRRLRAARPAARRAAAGADRRAHAARRSGRELLVPAPPGGVRVDRCPRPRRRSRRHGVRRGVRRGGAGRRGGHRGRRRRQSRGPRARSSALQPARPVRSAAGLVESWGRSRERRRGRVPPDDRARPGSGGACSVTSGRCCGRAGWPTSRRPTC